MRLEHWIYTVPLRLRSVFRRARVEQELDEELRYHLERQTEENVAKGMTAEEARYAALRAVGGVEQHKEECRDARRVRFVEDLVRDLRYGLRSLARSPGFSTVAVVTLALGIGANTAVFSVVNGVLLKPLAYRDPERIVTVSPAWPKKAGGPLSKQVSIPDFRDWHDQSTAFEAMAYYATRKTSVMAGTEAEYARATTVSPEFFRVFGVEPAAGRSFSPEEAAPASGGAVVISYAFWQSRFDGETGALGRAVHIFGKAVTIVGVAPPGFDFPDKTDIWFPANTITGETTEHRAANNYLAVGRLRSDTSLEQAQAQIASIAARLEQQYPETNEGRSVVVTRMQDDMVGDVRPTLYLLLAAVGVVLLVACANIATLLLAKATARTREITIRTALGASRGRVARQLVTESVLLAVLAGAVGLVLAIWLSKGLVALAPEDVPRLADVRIDATVLAFTFGVSLAASLLFGVAPSLRASRVHPNDMLKKGTARAGVGGGAGAMRRVLVVAEIALAVMLLAVAGLLIRSFVTLQNVDLGFRPENVLVMRATVPMAPAPDAKERADRFFAELLADVSALPGVTAGGATMAPPGNVDASALYWVDHMPEVPNVSAPEAVVSVVAPGTFATLGIPLRNGRDFGDDDAQDAPLTAVVNETLARSAFPGQDALGHVVFCGYDTWEPMKIVGVVGDVRQDGPAHEPRAEIYMPYRQHFYNGSTLSVVVRTASDPTTLSEAMRHLVREQSPEVPVMFTTLEASLYENVATPRFRTLLLSIFAAIAVCVAMAGVYGVMAYVVGQSSNEIGLRMALGASSGDVLRLVLRQGMTLAGLGLVIGLAGAVAATRLVTSMLFEVEPGDPRTYTCVALLLGAVALLACYVPARRASRVDPMVALRCE